ncbi:histone-lysine N-methyltransferase SETMAR-like [Cryptotermes secundus]|uniref:histone-lysine N-methyltransferase SETMAR-like n=1 Tax=Cryptotermes secundus TaxID=105785 RepID=UPI000CD7D6ED|nr:histone-lysine N-methyltransferase SETMAR-like [Cryptotermes secundus]
MRGTIRPEANGDLFWDKEVILLLNWMPPKTTIDSDWYCNSLCQLRRHIQQRCHGKWGRGILLQHDNAWPHGSRQTIATLGALGYTVLPHPPYLPNLAPSDYALFDERKDIMRGKSFTSNELQADVQKWRRDTSKEGFAVQIRKLLERWQRCIDIGWEYF